MADQLLVLLNVSIPFSLYTSFDYLGFWLYAVFGLLVAGHLYSDDMSSKVAAILLLALESADIESSFISVSTLLLIIVVAMLIRFRGRGRLGH
jgi:hypothetical protein